MHEMGIADAILKMVDRIKQQEHAAAVRSITLEVGDLSGIVPYFLAECWEAVAAGTEYQTARLHIHPVPATARCEDCKKIFVVDAADLRCPDCKSNKLTPLSGKDLTIAEIEVCDAEEEP